MVKRLLALGFALGLSACSNLPAVGQAGSDVMRLNLDATLDGQRFVGTFVGSDAKTHVFTFTSDQKIDSFIAESCHRWVSSKDPINPGWSLIGQTGNTFQYVFTPSPGVEDTGKCPLRLYLYNSNIGSPQFYAIGLFKNAHFDLPAENICNGADAMTGGTSMCQSAAGLTERIRFQEQVIAARPRQDGTPIPNQCQGNFVDAFTWQYTLPTKECMVEFATTDLTKPTKYHLLMAYGFTKSE